MRGGECNSNKSLAIRAFIYLSSISCVCANKRYAGLWAQLCSATDNDNILIKLIKWFHFSVTATATATATRTNTATARKTIALRTIRTMPIDGNSCSCWANPVAAWHDYPLSLCVLGHIKTSYFMPLCAKLGQQQQQQLQATTTANNNKQQHKRAIAA